MRRMAIDRSALDTEAAHTSSQTRPPSPLQTGFVEQGREIRAALCGSSPDQAADESLLLDLVCRQMPIYLALEEAQLNLAVRLTVSADAPTAALALARVMKEITHLSGAIQKRIEGSLATAAGLRAQRRFLSLRGAK